MTQQHASFGLEPFQYCTKTIMFSYAIEVSLGTMASLWKKSSKCQTRLKITFTDCTRLMKAGSVCADL